MEIIMYIIIGILLPIIIAWWILTAIIIAYLIIATLVYIFSLLVQIKENIKEFITNKKNNN